MNLNIYNTTEYENKWQRRVRKNKANSNPNKANLRKAKMNVNLTLTKGYRKKDDFLVRINKPNFQNGQNERKLNFNKGLQKKRCFSSPKNKPNSNPILSAVGGLQMNKKSLAKKSGHTRLAGVLKIVCKNAPFGYTHPDCRATAGFAQTRAIHVERKGFGDGGK